MATRAIRMVDEYPSADNKRRVDIILSNFQNFPEIMYGYEESLKFLIINERKSERRKTMGNLGVRVQTSGTSDKTANEAIESVMLSEALRSGMIEEELRDIECPEKYLKEAEGISDMREDFALIKALVKTLPWPEYQVMHSYLTETHDLIKIADATNSTYEAVRNRIKKARQKIRRDSELYFNKKYYITED